MGCVAPVKKCATSSLAPPDKRIVPQTVVWWKKQDSPQQRVGGIEEIRDMLIIDNLLMLDSDVHFLDGTVCNHSSHLEGLRKCVIDTGCQTSLHSYFRWDQYDF